MSDEIDPDLKRLFALTAEPPADEAFVAMVAAKTARLRLLAVAGWSLGLILLAAVLAAGATWFGVAISQVVAAPGWLSTALAASPFGWVAALALTGAGAVCWRAMAQIAAGRGNG